MFQRWDVVDLEDNQASSSGLKHRMVTIFTFSPFAECNVLYSCTSAYVHGKYASRRLTHRTHAYDHHLLPRDLSFSSFSCAKLQSLIKY